MKQIQIALFLAVILATNVSGQNSPSSEPSCSYAFSGDKTYATCLSLPVLGCHLHWTYDASSRTADIAFRATGVKLSSSGNWVAWALNPTASGMVGAQCLVAYQNSNGDMRAYTSSVDSYAISSLDPTKLSFNVSDLKAESSGNQIIIYATVKLPGNTTTFNHVWQVGPLSNGSPGMHQLDQAHQGSQGTIDFSTGIALPSNGIHSQIKLKNAHGVVNAVSWGIMMPIGAIVARYLKTFKSADPTWFYLHVTIQCLAYLVGVAGWISGMILGHHSKGITYHAHRNIGIALFIMGTLQVIVGALFRPKKDNKNRIYWNLFHWSFGYSVIILSIINVFKGLDILDPGKKWKMSYTILIIVLGSVATILEVSTWAVVLWKKLKVNRDNVDHAVSV